MEGVLPASARPNASSFSKMARQHFFIALRCCFLRVSLRLESRVTRSWSLNILATFSYSCTFVYSSSEGSFHPRRSGRWSSKASAASLRSQARSRRKASLQRSCQCSSCISTSFLSVYSLLSHVVGFAPSVDWVRSPVVQLLVLIVGNSRRSGSEDQKASTLDVELLLRIKLSQSPLK